MKIILDYIWLDGNVISDVRYVTKIIDADIRRHDGIGSFFGKTPRLLDQIEDEIKIPSILVDGTNINQKSENNNMVTLKPVKLYQNPLKNDSFCVLCEPYDNEKPHKSDSRIILKELNIDEPLEFLEQFVIYDGEYDNELLFNDKSKINKKYHYSSNKSGYDELIDDIIFNSINIGINISGVINKYGSGAKWEIIISNNNPLILADDVVVLRHLMYKLSHKHNKTISFDKKFFMKIESDKDAITDPYLLTKKLIKSFVV